MGAPVLTEEEMRTLLEERDPFEEGAAVELQLQGVSLPYERTEERYYVSQSVEEGAFKGTLEAVLDGESLDLAWAEDKAFDDMISAVGGHVFHCVLYNDRQYRLVSVLFTGLPVMSIEGDMEEAGSRIIVFDAVFNAGGGYDVTEAAGCYDIRGNYSRRFEKIGYGLEFEQDVRLLGMRSDDDWDLKAMYSDKSKLRDKLSIELWNQIAVLSSTEADTGCRMEYLELIVNGEYRGLYGLVEPTDYKSLGLNKNRDIIYKAAAQWRPDNNLLDQSEAQQSFECEGIKIKQSGREYVPGLWTPFRLIWNSGYGMESEEDLEILYSCIDRQNFVNYDLYYNVIAGVDNAFSNIIYSVSMNSDGGYTIRRIPWDENYSWGDDFDDGEDIKYIRYNPELAETWLEEEVFSRMQRFDETLLDDMLRTWTSWRQSFLTEEYWKSYAKSQMEYLVSSGAFSRDTIKWPDSENTADLSEIEYYIDTRFIWMDQYLQEQGGSS